MVKKILILAGDGVGQEVSSESEKILMHLIEKHHLEIEVQHGLIGGAAIDATGQALPDATLELAKSANAILLGAVGGPKWENGEVRPEQGLLAIRRELDCFANLRPAILSESLADASTLKADVVSGLDLMIIRELTGGIYFGEPRKMGVNAQGRRQALNTLVYSEDEIARIGHIAFKMALARNKRLCSVDKANVLESSQLWRAVMDEVAQEYPEVSLSHMYVDNAAMQLVRSPKQFDVMVTGNLFGDILSDCAAMLTGSIGMLPSASLNSSLQGIYEPVHGSAPDIAGRGVANPLASILSLAMLFKHSLELPEIANDIENAVAKTLDLGYRTKDISSNDEFVSTEIMGDLVLKQL